MVINKLMMIDGGGGGGGGGVDNDDDDDDDVDTIHNGIQPANKQANKHDGK